jgi:hypothetical protein
MYVGHTHNQNDQIHGRLAVALNHYQALTLSELRRLIEDAYDPNFDPAAISVICRNANVELLPEVVDWRRFLQNFAQPQSTAGSFYIQGFRYRLEESGILIVDLKYRHDTTWTCGHRPYQHIACYQWEPLRLQPVCALKEFLGDQPELSNVEEVKQGMNTFLNGLMGRLHTMDKNGSFTQVHSPISQSVVVLFSDFF